MVLIAVSQDSSYEAGIVNPVLPGLCTSPFSIPLVNGGDAHSKTVVLFSMRPIACGNILKTKRMAMFGVCFFAHAKYLKLFCHIILKDFDNILLKAF